MRKIFQTPEGESIEDEAVEVSPSVISYQQPIVWQYEDDEITLRRVILYPKGVKLWKAINETDSNGSPLMSFEPSFDAQPWTDSDFEDSDLEDDEIEP